MATGAGDQEGSRGDQGSTGRDEGGLLPGTASGEGPEAFATAEAVEEAEIAAHAHGAGFDAARNAVYNKHREAFLAACHRWVMFGVILSSSAAVAALFSEGGTDARLFALVPAALGALDMAFGFSHRARDHAILAGQYMEIAAKLEEGDVGQAGGEARLYRLYAQEPPIFHVVNALAYNEMLDSIGNGDLRRFAPTCWQRLLKHVWRFEGVEIPCKPVA